MTNLISNKKVQDISGSDKILSYLFFLEEVIYETVRYRKSFRNYLNVSFNLLRAKFPIKAILINGKHVILPNRTSVNYLAYASNSKGVAYDIETGIWYLSCPQNMKNNSVRLFSGRGNGEIINIFLKGTYSQLPVKDRIVIDVGANIGDSSIYFAINGAQKVISIEPFPMNYETARKNIDMNKMSDKIFPLLGACTSSSGYTAVDSMFQEIGACTLSNPSNLDVNRVINIPMWTLEYILEKNDIKSGALLKMDCEGCEYEAILSATSNVLQRFSHIMIEYHYGYNRLKKKLEDSGFIVFTTRPKAHHRDYLYEFVQDKWMYVGYLYAENKTKK